MIVMPASRMLSAISFGVFCRSAPSTSAIMRSRKVEPCAAVMRDLDPVGDHARAAGDRRAVAAALADDRRRFAGDRGLVDRGDAFDHLAVARDEVAGLDQHDVARLELRRAATCSNSRPSPLAQPLGHRSRCAVWRSVSAWALPRPSATASAKLANSTVNQSQSCDLAGEAEHAAAVPRRRRSRRKRIVVSTDDDLDHEHDRIA